MITRTLLLTALSCAAPAVAAEGDVPDISGFYDTATLTPLQRPEIYGDNLTLTPERARAIAEEAAARLAEGDAASDPDREAPPEGGDGSEGAAGNVGGYNSFWIDNGDSLVTVDGTFRTSLITDPPNGRLPEMLPGPRMELMQRYAEFARGNTGEAWWLDVGDGSGPYDDMERRPLGERCLLGFGSTGGPPMLPVLYNNLKRIVQTDEYVMILVEMVHDARIIRLDDTHLPADVTRWLGDSIGHWQGGTLVVDTTNFHPDAGFRGAAENLHVVERFTPQADGSLLYQFTVEDDTVWTAPWSGEYTWPRTGDRIYEYACHEGNYALGNIMRGARLLEAEHEAGPSAR
jgi:hypothetical protein